MHSTLLHGLTRLGVLASHPFAFVVVGLYTVAWYAFERESFDWHAYWRAEHRDTQALHAKLDELLRADKNARTGLARLDEDEPEEIEQKRKNARHLD